MIDNKGYFETNGVLIMDNGFSISENRDFFYTNLPKAKCVVINYQEHIPTNELFHFDFLAENKILTYFTTFIITLKNYFDIKYPQNKFIFCDIMSVNNSHLTMVYPDLYWAPPFERKYLLKFFSSCRKPHRDVTLKFIIDNDLLNVSDNVISFRENKFSGFNNGIYMDAKEENSDFGMNKKTFENFEFIHETQKNITPYGDQTLQDMELYKIHSESMFNILCEAVVPYHNSEHEILRNISSVSKRTILPIIFKNVFHIYPKNEPLEKWLVSNGFELFFNSDEEFLSNLNKDYYYSKDVQLKLEKNAIKMQKLVSNNTLLMLRGLSEKYNK
jgi:hypothetical protein